METIFSLQLEIASSWAPQFNSLPSAVYKSLYFNQLNNESVCVSKSGTARCGSMIA